MAKIAILGDLHFGIKDDDRWVQAYQKSFIEYLDNYCMSNGIETIFQLGDWFDVRRGISQDTLHFQRTVVDPIMAKYATYVIVGNHDAHLRESLHPNSCTEILARNDFYHVIEDMETINVYGIDFDFIPWICKENCDDIYSKIGVSNSKYALMHAELNGFYFSKGQKSSGGDDAGFLKKYKQVWSGHFHTQSKAGNIHYLGTPYTLTMADADEVRGFFIFDTETHELEFVGNPDCWHHKVHFNADTFNPKCIESFTDKSVKIVVEKRSSDSRPEINFDVIEQRIADVAHQLQTIDELEIVEHVADNVKSVKDVTEYVAEYVDSLEESTGVRERTKNMFGSLYKEAQVSK